VGEEQRASFESLKTALCEAPVPQVPDFEMDFVLVVDASDIAISALLNQRLKVREIYSSSVTFKV
jgi:hypothetical protein